MTPFKITTTPSDILLRPFLYFYFPFFHRTYRLTFNFVDLLCLFSFLSPHA